MQLAVIDVYDAGIELLALTEEEDKILKKIWDEMHFDIGELYETAMNIAIDHGYDIFEQGKTVLVGEFIKVCYENDYAKIREL